MRCYSKSGARVSILYEAKGTEGLVMIVTSRFNVLLKFFGELDLRMEEERQQVY